MNIDSVLEEPVIRGVVDHDWWVEGLVKRGEPTFDPEKAGVKNPNHTVPELEVEWGCEPGAIPIDEPAGVVERNLPAESQSPVGDPVIIFARDMMNRGMSAARVRAAVQKRYGNEGLRVSSDGLNKQLALDGMVGRFVLDARGYKNCREAARSLATSPYKSFVSKVIGCSCGDHLITPVAKKGFIEDSDVAGGLDGFLADDKEHVAATEKRCRTTALRVVESRGDLDDEYMDKTLIDISNLTGLPSSVVSKIKAMKCSSASKLMTAFRLADKHAAPKMASSGPVKAESLVPAGMDVDVIGEAAPPIGVDGRAAYPDFGLTDALEHKQVLDVVYEPWAVPSSQVPGAVQAGEKPRRVALELPSAPAVGVEIDPEIAQEDVDMVPENSGVFAGVDEIGLDDPKKAEKELDISLSGGMEW